MTIVDDLVDYLIDEHEVLPDRFFIQDAAVVSKNLHHAINHVVHNRWGYIVLRSRDKVDAELLCEKVINPVNMLKISSSANALTNAGGGSPGQNLTFLKNVSLVVLLSSFRTKM